jgi:hypothetical protein
MNKPGTYTTDDSFKFTFQIAINPNNQTLADATHKPTQNTTVGDIKKNQVMKMQAINAAPTFTFTATEKAMGWQED